MNDDSKSAFLRALMRLPIEERRQILGARSRAAGDQFKDDAEWKKWEAADAEAWVCDSTRSEQIRAIKWRPCPDSV